MHRLLLLLLLQIVCHSLLAVPARRALTRVTLPDGTKREAYIRGDERCHWLESPDGQPVGERVYSHALAARAHRAPLDHQRLTHRASAPVAESSLLLEGSFPTTGKRRLLALLINFANTTPTYSREQFDAMLNAEGYNGTGSFRDYFLDQSRGLLDITTTVTPWITVSQAKQFYNIDNTPTLIAEALKQIEGDIDLRDYDNDGDGILDGLIVIHAGDGQEATGNATDIWSHSSTVYGMQQDGISLFRYTIEPELLHGQPSTIGVFCHEFGHNLGALDYYDTNYSSGGAYGGTGPWDIMGEGAWNGSGGLGTHPAPFTAWQRWQFGWSEPLVLDRTQHVEATANNREAHSYVMHTTTEGDYFVFENVQNNTPWTSDIPGHGLVVTHVIESIVRQRMSMNNINATYPQGIYTVCADAHSDPQEDSPASYGDLTSSAAPFPGMRRNTALSDETLPSTHSQDGRYGYIGLQNIVENDGIVAFDFIQGIAPQRPECLTSIVRQGNVQLSWNFPDNCKVPVSCRIYREGQLIATVNPDAHNGRQYTYVDEAPATSGLVRYAVDAIYDGGLTSALAHVDTRVPMQMATDFTAYYDADAESFQLSWKTPSELTRCTNDLHYDLVDHHATSFRYAHRFRADDLLPFVGREIRSVTFLPQQRSTDATYYISVWRMPASRDEFCPMAIPSDGLQLVAQRKVSEFSPTYLRTTPFVSRPKIERGYDYLIGVEIASNGLAEVVTDQSELQNGFGNMMSLNGGVWQTDPAAQGNYILSATLVGDTPQEETSELIVTSGTAPSTSIFNQYYSPYKADYDLRMPLGFTLYVGATRVAESTGSHLSLPIRQFTPDADGQVEFHLVSAYKEHNESRPLSVTVPYELPQGVMTPAASDAVSPVVYDLAGRRVAHSFNAQGVMLRGNRKQIIIR